MPVDQGQYDFGIIDLAVMMNCAARGLDLAAVAGSGRARRSASSRSRSTASPSRKDLEGQTVAFDVGSGDFQLWPAFVKATGIDDKKVNKVTMDAAALIKALIEKQVKAEGNFFGSIAPSLWAQGLEINSILYEDYGVKMFSNVVACKRSTVEKKPELCEAFVGGLMEGLQARLPQPREIGRNASRERQGIPGRQRRQPEGDRVRPGGQHRAGRGAVRSGSTALGYMDPDLVATTAKTVETYMGVKNAAADCDKLFTNKFVGAVKLTEAEWAEVEKRSEKYLPRKSS